MAKNIPIL